MIKKTLKTELREIKAITLESDNKDLKEKYNKLLNGELNRQSINEMSNISVKIYQNNRKIENLKSGKPELGYDTTREQQ